ncbi:MAG TPA: hypothetical protein VE974_06155 [Thermoanaerobaculia bacterium]|nr:hypothetical protein [Thermoanaerobaculia bacterium]
MKKLFIVRKYVSAASAAEALRIEKQIAPDDVWLDDDWKKSQPNAGANVMGFAAKKSRKAKRNRF